MMLVTRGCPLSVTEANEKVYPASEVKKLKARIAELERALGRKTVDNEILTYAVELAVETSPIENTA